ncbi:MAG TPA: BadF/BadG/BcrA/BcrD ATPase family protein [Chthoniobacterales bacterium]
MSDASLTQDIFVGVDGGATKTIARVENARRELLGQGQGGPANIRLSVEESWQSINAALNEAFAPSGLRPDDVRHRFCCGAGLAGTEVTSACDEFLNTPHPFARLILKSDGYTSCLGAHGGRDGALIAIGTGTVAFQIEGDKEYKVGGWGFPHGDEGSGAWLGLEAVRLTLHWLDGRGEPSPLLESVYAHFDNDLMQLVVWANQANATQFAQIAPLVIEHVKRQTPLAVTLIQQAAREIDRLGAALAVQSVNKALPCSLLGGLAQFIEPWLGELLRSRLTPCESDSASGALLMIRKAVQDQPLAETGSR